MSAFDHLPWKKNAKTENMKKSSDKNALFSFRELFGHAVFLFMLFFPKANDQRRAQGKQRKT